MAYYLANSYKDLKGPYRKRSNCSGRAEQQSALRISQAGQELLTQLSRIEKTAGSKGKVQPASKKTAGTAKTEPAAKTEKPESAAKTDSSK